MYRTLYSLSLWVIKSWCPFVLGTFYFFCQACKKNEEFLSIVKCLIPSKALFRRKERKQPKRKKPAKKTLTSHNPSPPLSSGSDSPSVFQLVQTQLQQHVDSPAAS